MKIIYSTNTLYTYARKAKHKKKEKSGKKIWISNQNWSKKEWKNENINLRIKNNIFKNYQATEALVNSIGRQNVRSSLTSHIVRTHEWNKSENK